MHGKNGKKKPRKKMTPGGKTKKSAVPKMTMGSATRFINSEMKKMNPGGPTKPSAGAIKMAKGILKKAGMEMKYGSMTMPKAKYGLKTRMTRKKKK